ncbi:MAG: hypothetical protein M1150_01800 [Patescibacteria group bacterium]|nr:hypothetical protein [Patescibacteria group bacterium]
MVKLWSYFRLTVNWVFVNQSGSAKEKGESSFLLKEPSPKMDYTEQYHTKLHVSTRNVTKQYQNRDLEGGALFQANSSYCQQDKTRPDVTRLHKTAQHQGRSESPEITPPRKTQPDFSLPYRTLPNQTRPNLTKPNSITSRIIGGGENLPI